MKAQRRHELRTNQLARSLETFPEKLARHANKIIFALLAIVLVVLLIRYRLNSADQRRQNARAALAEVQFTLTELRDAPPDAERQRRLQDQLGELDTIDSGDSDLPDVSAQALVARGDANLDLATGELMSPQVADAEQTPEDYLKAADDAYSTVLDKYSDQTLLAATARFGSAAVAEDRKQWDEAAKQYRAIADQSGLDDSIKQYAKSKLDSLKLLEQPVYVGQPVLPTPAPTTTTTPASLGPMTPADMYNMLKNEPITQPSFVSPATRPS